MSRVYGFRATVNTRLIARHLKDLDKLAEDLERAFPKQPDLMYHNTCQLPGLTEDLGHWILQLSLRPSRTKLLYFWMST